MIEAPNQASFTVLRELRKQFGPGKAGISAFRLIAKGVVCEADNRMGNKCQNTAQITVDFDVPRVNNLEQIPSCVNCQPLIEAIVITDFNREGSFPSFGINGRGRA